MTGRLNWIAAVCAIVAAAFLAQPLSGQERTDSNVNDRIRQIKEQIERSRQEIQKKEKMLDDMKNRKDRVIGEISVNERKIEAVHQNLWAIRKEEQILSEQLTASRAKLSTATDSVSMMADNYSELLVTLYKNSNTSPLGSLLNSGSFSQALWGWKMLCAVADYRLEIIRVMQTHRLTIESSMSTISDALNARKALEETKNRERRRLESSTEKRQDLLKQIDNDLDMQASLIVQLREEKQKQETEMARILKSIKLEGISDELQKFDFSKQKKALPWPVIGELASTFGVETDKITGTRTINHGIEISTTHGEPVRAVAKGKVVWRDVMRGYGNYIIVFHPPDYYTTYGHLQDFLVNPGQEVKEGEIIASAGSTGLLNDRNARLLLEVRHGEVPEDPLAWLRPLHSRATR